MLNIFKKNITYYSVKILNNLCKFKRIGYKYALDARGPSCKNIPVSE